MSPAERATFLIGLMRQPYARGGDGPDGFDCYGLARHVLQRLFAIDLPGRDSAGQVEARRWRRVARPQDGALVFMRFCGDRHVGVWLEDAPQLGGVFHIIEPPNWQPGDRRPAVVFENEAMLRARQYLGVRFYQHR